MNVLQEELINADSLLQLIQTMDDKIFLCCRYSDKENGNMKNDVIHEFTEENKKTISVFQTEEHIIVMDEKAKEINKIYNMEYHYFLRGNQCCAWNYEKQIKSNEAIHIMVEQNSTTPVFVKTNLPKR